jgi:hypothetical protein
MQHQYEDEDPFYNPQLQSTVSKQIRKPKWSKCCFCKWKCAEYRTTRFVKPISWCKKSIILSNLNKSILNVTMEILMLFSRIIQVSYKFQDKSVNPVEQAAYNNDVRYQFNDVFFRIAL